MPCPLLKCAVILLCLHLPSFLTTTWVVDAQVMDPSSASTVAVIPVGAAVDGVDSSLGTVNPVHQDAASDVDAAREDAVVLTGALEGGDYAALVRVVGERVAPRVGGGAYATALVDALGARGMVRVAAHLPTGEGALPAGSAGGAEGVRGCRVSSADGTGAAGVGLACTWTSLLATATSSPLWTDDHRESLARDLASLVTTTGDLAEPDTLLLPLGFRRLLTADQDPLTTATASTQAPGAGGGQSGPGQVPGTTSPDQVPGAGSTASPGADDGRGLGAGRGRSGSRDPLALDPKFLAALTRGVMVGETGAAAGGLRVGWVEYARLTTTAGGGYANFPEGTPQDVTAHRASYDPLPAVLTAVTRTPATVLDVLAPSLPGADPSTLGPSGRGRESHGVDAYKGAVPGPSGRSYGDREQFPWVDGSLWAWVAARAQGSGPACLEALTAAVASASTLRYRSAAPTLQPNPYEARAAWLTEQAVATLAGVDTTAWTPTARRATAVMLANSIGDIDDTASGTAYKDRYTSFDELLPVAWHDRRGRELGALLQDVLTDDVALTTVSRAAGVLTTRRLVVTARKTDPGTDLREAYGALLGGTRSSARLYGYIYATCAAARQAGVDEAGPAAGIMLAALEQGMDSATDPPFSWQPPSGLADFSQKSPVGLVSDLNGLTQKVAVRLTLEVIGALDSSHLIPQDAYTLGDGRPVYDWITKDGSNVWRLDRQEAVADPRGLSVWFQGICDPQRIYPVIREFIVNNFNDDVLKAQDPAPATAPRSPARHAVLVAVLTTATTLLVYNLSHTHQRRRERLRPIRKERLRRWRERHKSWYEE